MSRSPSGAIVVDANIILSAVRGRRTSYHIERVSGCRVLCTTDHAHEEVLRVLDKIDTRPESRAAVELAFKVLPAIAVERYGASLDRAAASLSRAPASRTGSTADAHILALAWTLDADIWSHDRDFAGTGWPSWSSANLIDALAGEAAA